MTKIRPFNKDDTNFLWDMLYEAIYVENPEEKGPKEKWFAIEGIAKYVKGFGELPNDKGFIAEDEEGNPIGAGWYRLFSSDNKGYGFISEDIPELSIALKSECRGKGVGKSLMEALIREARRNEFSAISLSVDPDNLARILYEKLGFQKVAMVGTSMLMRLDL